MMNRSATIASATKPRQHTIVQMVHAWLQSETFRLISFLLLHAFFGLIFPVIPLAATLHAGLVFAFGGWLILAKTNLNATAYLCAYITGAEVLWRMTQASIPWETGKIAVTIFMLIAMVRCGKLRGSMLAILFFILLLPSIVLSSAFESSTDLYQAFSFNLTGPLALTVSVCFFSQVKLTTQQLHNLFICLAGPVISIATVALRGIVTAKEVLFNDASNFVASGGFGPNQVSSILGLGMLSLMLWSFGKTVSWHLRLFLYVVVLWLGIQSALTFSRGGLYSALLGTVLASFFLVRERRTRVQLIGALTMLLLVTNYVIVPQLDAYTNGSISRRFSSTRLTGRDNLAAEDLQVFWDNLVMGVGPGQTYKYRGRTAKAAAHTEFTRVLAEHGLFGAFALLVLAILSILHFRQARTAAGKALTVAALCWSFTYMLVAAMRTVAPSFVFGLSACMVLPDNRRNE